MMLDDLARVLVNGVFVVACAVAATMCTGCGAAKIPDPIAPRTPHCQALVDAELVSYLARLNTSCGDFEDYAQCPEIDAIEEEFRKRDAEVAAECEKP